VPKRQERTMSDTTYTTDGDVRGSCGHQHHTIADALACLRVDQQGCAGLPGRDSYSDRYVVRGDCSPLAGDELLALRDLLEAGF
jgi:hypothetical protein